MLIYWYALLFLVLGVLMFSRWSVLLLVLYYCSFSTFTVLMPDMLLQEANLKVYRSIYAFLILCLVINVFFRFTPSSGFQVRNLCLIPYLAVILIVCLSAMYSPLWRLYDWEEPLSLPAILIVYMLFPLAAIQFQRQKDVAIFVAGTILCALGLTIWVVLTASESRFLVPRAVTSVNPTYLSNLIVLGTIPLVDIACLRRKFIVTFLVVVAILLTGYGTILLGSRGPFVGLVAAGTVIALGGRKFHASWKVVVGISLVVLVITAASLLPGTETTIQRFRAPDLPSLNSRMDIWGQLVHRILNRGLRDTLIGEGLSSSAPFLFKYTMWADPHNTYLQWLFEQGIVGSALFLLFLYSVGRRILSSNHAYTNVLIGWYVYFLVVGLSGTISDDKTFWLFLGVAVGSCAFQQHQPSKKKVGRLEDELRLPSHPGTRRRRQLPGIDHRLRIKQGNSA